MTNLQVIEAFIQGNEGKSRTMTAKVITSDKFSIQILYDYEAIIAYKYNGKFTVTDPEYSIATSKRTTITLGVLDNKIMTRANLSDNNSLQKLS